MAEEEGDGPELLLLQLRGVGDVDVEDLVDVLLYSGASSMASISSG